MKNLALLILLTLFTLGPAALAQDTTAPRARLGTNLAGPADWGTELAFVDVFRQSRQWISQKKGAGWGKGPELKVDEAGWVTQLEPGCYVETALCPKGGHYPSGKYTVLYEGKGKLAFWGSGTLIEDTPGRAIIDVDSSKGPIWLHIGETLPGDYIRNIRVIMPGFEGTYKAERFHPDFLRLWKGMACYRFMVWGATNDSKTISWADRPKMTDATWTIKGVPVEVMVDLCNRQKSDAWFCMPHLADDDYVRNFAAYVKANLDPSLKAYIEYSNEVWNSQFEQTRYAQRKAKELGLGPAERPWEGGCMYYAQRSGEIFKIWEQEFGGRDRIVRVVAWQAANSGWWLDGLLLSRMPKGSVDSLAIAPYMSMNLPPSSDKPDALTAEKVAGWTLTQVLDHVENKSLPESIVWINTAAAVAKKYGVTLTAYEGGQHLVGAHGGENNDALTKLFHQANADPRMGECYKKYLAAWQQAGGDLFCNFSSTNLWSKWGSWGALQYQDGDPTKSPKYMALMRWAKALGQDVNLPAK